MPWDRKKYPARWEEFSASIRFERAHSQCECTGQCGMHTPNPMPRRCIERHQQPAQFFRGKVHLTTAHLCQCDPPCSIPEHVIAACQRCHLRIDAPRKAHTRRAKNKSKLPPHQLPLDLASYDAL